VLARGCGGLCHEVRGLAPRGAGACATIGRRRAGVRAWQALVLACKTGQSVQTRSESPINVSNPESFINEVTEEVRRDRLFAAFRKYGWIGALLVLGVVGGTAWREWSSVQTDQRAQAFGDGVLAALDESAPDARRAALDGVPADGAQAGLLRLLQSSDPAEGRAETLAVLEALAADTTQAQSYRDLAVLRRVIVAGAEMPLADRRAALEAISPAGRAFRTLAQEQLAYLLIEEGNEVAAIAALRALTTDQEAPGGLRSRAGQMITALGGDATAPLDAG
jgi:hypothetical protein